MCDTEFTTDQSPGVDKGKPQTDKHEDMGWPEDARDVCRPYLEYQRWTYSYLSQLLAKGSRQQRDGMRLSEEDLFDVPESIKSETLSAHFRYVPKQIHCASQLFFALSNVGHFLPGMCSMGQKGIESLATRCGK